EWSAVVNLDFSERSVRAEAAVPRPDLTFAATEIEIKPLRFLTQQREALPIMTWVAASRSSWCWTASFRTSMATILAGVAAVSRPRSSATATMQLYFGDPDPREIRFCKIG